MDPDEKPAQLFRPMLPGRSSPIAHRSDPARWLLPRRSRPWRDGLCWVGAGIAGFGAAGVGGQPALEVPALLLGLGAGAAVTSSGVRRQRRQDVEDRLVEALAPALGLDGPDRRGLRARHWTPGWPGIPQRLTLRYAPGCADDDPAWKAGIVAKVEGRLLVPFEVLEHDRRACLLVLGAAPEPAMSDRSEPPYARVRAERAVRNLIGPTAEVTGFAFDEAGQLTSMSVTHQAGDKIAAAGYRARVERVISTMHPGRWRARWDLEEDSVVFEIRPSFPTSVWAPPEVPEDVEDLLTRYDDVAIPYAVDEDGEEVCWWPARAPQFLITGGTGTGKTSTTHAIVGKITQLGWPVWVLDGKRVEFLRHRTWPGVQVVATTVEQQVALVHRVYQLVRTRFALMEEEGLAPEDFEPLFVVLDEWSDFVAELLDWYARVKVKGDPTKPPTLREEASLARQARLARVHLLKTMQRPDVSLLGGQGGEVRSNFTQRASIGRNDPQGAMMMWDSPAIGVTIPRGARQRATTTGNDGLPVEVQCYRFPSMTAPADSEQGRLREALRPTSNRHERLLILPPEDGPDGEEPTFWQYAEAPWGKAADHPNLDPVLRGQRHHSSATGRRAASALSVLGLAHDGEEDLDVADDETRADRLARPRLRLVEDVVEECPTDEWATDLNLDEYEGYGAPVATGPYDLVVGDLIEVEDYPGSWVVVDEPPEDDPGTPGFVAVSWRGDGDESGSLSLPDDTRISVRHPLEVYS